VIVSAIVVGLLTSVAPGDPATRSAPAKTVVLTVDGTIDPAIADYLVSNIEQAPAELYVCIVIELNTPGGLISSTREIVKAILNSDVPVVTFVSPSGARAASAGTFITLASHVAAMAPGTNIGAAHPVTLGAGQAAATQPSETMTEKLVNDSAAYIRGLAERRGRNVQWAEKAVRESVSITATQAVESNVVDLIASSVPDLLDKIDGRELELAGRNIRLNTRNSEVVRHRPSWIQNFLHAISNPEVAYILLMLGIWGLYFELANPGMILPGVIGGVCLLLGMYALYVLPTNLAGVLLIILAIILFIAELKTVTNGILTIGGVISFVLGSFLLFSANTPFGAVPWDLIVVCSGATGGFFAVVLWLVIKAQRARIIMGIERLAGLLGVAQSKLSPSGVVLVQGEQWSAKSAGRPIDEGQRIRVIGVEGLTLKVEPASPDQQGESE